MELKATQVRYKAPVKKKPVRVETNIGKVIKHYNELESRFILKLRNEQRLRKSWKEREVKYSCSLFLYIEIKFWYYHDLMLNFS